MSANRIGWVVGVGLMACALLLVFGRPAPAQQQCVSVEASLTAIEQRGYEHTVLQGSAAAAFLKVRTDLGEPDASFDFVMVVFMPDQGVALIGYGKGAEICEGVVMPLSVAQGFLRKA